LQDSNELMPSPEDGFSILTSEDSVSKDSDSASTLSEIKIKEVNIDREYVMTVLGCDDQRVIRNEDALEEFIVLKALMDNNMSKLAANDSLIFKNILMDIFPNTPFPKFELNAIQDLIKSMLKDEHLHDGEDFVK